MNKAPGIELLRRYADGEELTDREMESLRAAVYMIRQTYLPPRTWASFQWSGIDPFMHEIWPQVRERHEIRSGLFEHGSVKP